MADNHLVSLTVDNRFLISVKKHLYKTVYRVYLANDYEPWVKSPCRNGSSAQLFILLYANLKWNNNFLGRKYILQN